MALETKPDEAAPGQSGFQLIESNPQSNIEAINALIKRTGYPLTQENGQRRYGPPPDWSGPNVPDRGCEAFIGKIPRDCFEDELVPVLEQVGPVYELRLMMEYSGYNRGYGFVMYTCREHAKKCVNELNNYEIRKGKMIGVCRSVDNCRLFVGGIPKNKKREEILEEMRKVTDDVVNVIVYPSAHDKTKNRGFAFVQYSSHRAAAIARRKLIPNRVQIFGQPIAVDWAEPEPEVDEDVMATVKIVYVRNLMLSTTEQTIKNEFEKVTKADGIERVKKVKDFAFVHFKEREDAINCINRLNGTSIDGSTIELSLSKPADKVNLQKLLRANSNQLLDCGLLFAPNMLPVSPIVPYSLMPDPNAQLATVGCDVLGNDSQNMAQLTISPHLDFNQKILNYSTKPYFPPNKLNTKNKQHSNRFYNINKFTQNGLVIGNVKKQPSNQDVPIQLFQHYNQLPVLPYPGQPIQYIPKSYVNMLEDICNKEGLSQPVFSLHTTTGTDQDGKEIGLYIYKVTISNSSNPAPLCSNRLMRTIEEAKNDAAEYVISQYFPQYLHSMSEMNDQYIQCQTTSVMPNAIPYMTVGDAQVSPAESNSQDAASDHNSGVSAPSNESNAALIPNPYVLSQPSQVPPLVPQYILDSNGQCILYPTQAYY